MRKTSLFSVTGTGLGNIALSSRHYLGNPNYQCTTVNGNYTEDKFQCSSYWKI